MGEGDSLGMENNLMKGNEVLNLALFCDKWCTKILFAILTSKKFLN